jgi:hypothetical protein
MARSDSGRVVIDLDPEFKNELYSALREDDTNLKSWFLEKAIDYVEGKKQPSLFASQSTMPQSQNEFFSPPPKTKGDLIL